MKKYLYIANIVLIAILASCSDDEHGSNLSQVQRDLIGHAVNFNASMSDQFTSRTIYNDNGTFSDNDVMRIYRQYANADGSWTQGESYRMYKFKPTYANGTEILLNQNWKVEEKRTGYNNVADAKHAEGTFTQDESDSLTWENGSTVRFRAWSRSNYYNSIISGSKERYYPDFCIADYVNSSGPSEGIPLLLNHKGSRIVFMRKNNANQFAKVEICTEDWKDYKRLDNNTDHAADSHEYEAGKSDEQAKAEYDSVVAVYNKMCMPAGVKMQDQTLLAMPKTFWNTEKPDLRYLENYESQFIAYNTKTAQQIVDEVQRPVFTHLNGAVYLITIPYDMSTDEATQGNVLVLPACTRFRVYLYDVNNGDQNATSGYEGTYHILTLSDIQDKAGNKIYKNGMELLPSYSYGFYVGYRYGRLTVTADDNFSWEQQNVETEHLMDDKAETADTIGKYQWWKTAISNAIPKGMEDFEPKFHITTREEFLEFINLVNGTATTKTIDDPLRSVARYTKQGDKTIKSYQWFKQNEITTGLGGKKDTLFYTQEQLEQEGYIFYHHYHAANADRAAYSELDYLNSNYSFYDDNLNRHFEVYIDSDLDFADWQINAVGANESKPFMGLLDAQGHKFTNVNRGTEGYLFGYMDGGKIANLRIESTHKVDLLKKATNGAYILGISMKADSRTNAIAQSILGTSFVVGCIHEGDATGALVGEADNLYMYGCMQAAEGITNGALLGGYAPTRTWYFFTPQSSKKISWGRFMCNYYDKQLSPSANAVSTTKDNYNRLEYIRGVKSFVLKAKNDNLLAEEVAWTKLNASQQEAYYGLAPWKAMNYAIWRYNNNYGSTHKCTMHYEYNTTGYDHQYPVLVSGQCQNGTPAGIPDYNKINPIEQSN